VCPAFPEALIRASDADTRLLRHLPADMRVAIVIVNHLRTVATLLHELLPRHTALPVKLITEEPDRQPDHVFIIPEQRDLHVLDGEFRLKPMSKPRGWPERAASSGSVDFVLSPEDIAKGIVRIARAFA
jgi:chemotaxis response regulator CheB